MLPRKVKKDCGSKYVSNYYRHHQLFVGNFNRLCYPGLHQRRPDDQECQDYCAFGSINYVDSIRGGRNPQPPIQNQPPYSWFNGVNRGFLL